MSEAQDNSPVVARSSVLRATGVVSIVTLASRVLGMLRDILIANYFGAGMATDAFFTAFKIPNLLRRLVAEGSLSTAFVPVISDEMERGKRAVSEAITSTMGFCLSLTIIISGLGILFADEITLVFAIGWSNQPEKLALASSLLSLMFPYVVLISLTALSASALNALGFFAWASASPAILNIAFILGIVAFANHISPPIFTLAYALLVGGLAGLVPMLIAISRLGYSVRPRSPFHARAVSRLVRLMIPAVISSSVYQVMVFINSILVTMLEEGAPSWLYFADRLFQFPLGVFSMAVATAVLPALSRLSAKSDDQAFEKLLNETLGWVAFVTLPATAGLIVLAQPIVEAIYLKGAFTVVDARNTTLSLIAFAVGLWPLSSHTVLVRAFLAKKDTLTPALVAVCSILANIVFALSFMGPPQDPNANAATKSVSAIQSIIPDVALGHIGLALASSVASLCSLIALCFFMRGKLKVGLQVSTLLPSFAKTTFATFAMALVLWFARPALELRLSSTIVALLLEVVLGVTVFFLAAKVVRSSEMEFSMRLLRKR